MAGLNPDFSDEAVRGRLDVQISGLEPHLRPGHSTPDQLPPRAEQAQAAIDAIRHPPLDEDGAL